MISILLATRNRESSLQMVLQHYCQLEEPSQWEIILVDNGSTDGTHQVVRAFGSRLPLKYVIEPRAGKTIALNSGVPHIRGELVVLTDDDVLPCPKWLIHFRNRAAEHPECGVFAGPLCPRWPGSAPSWIGSEVSILCGAFAVSDPALREGPIEDVGKALGGNFAVRSQLLQQYGFDPRIGPCSETMYPMGSETEFLARLKSDGIGVWWTEDARGEHIIRAEQINKSWILSRAKRLGRGACYHERKPVSLLLGFPRWMIRRLAMRLLVLLRESALGTESRRLAARFEYLVTLYMLVECYRTCGAYHEKSNLRGAQT